MSGYARSYELGDCTNGKESEMEIEIALFIPPISFQMYWSDDNNTCNTPVTLSQGSNDIFKKKHGTLKWTKICHQWGS